MSDKLTFDLFSSGRWIGMAEGVDEDDARRMAARCLPTLLGRFTLVRWHGRLHPDNCVTSGGKVPDPKPEPELVEPAADLIAGLKFIADITAEELAYAKAGTGAEVALRHANRKAEELLAGLRGAP